MKGAVAERRSSRQSAFEKLLQRPDVLSVNWQTEALRYIEEARVFLEGFRFVETADRLNAAEVHQGMIAPGGFMPAAVIIGPPRSGKTCFVRELLQSRGHRHPWPKLLPKTEPGIRRELDAAVGFAWFDSPRISLHSPALERFIYTSKIPVFLTGAEIKLSLRLQSISRIVHLEAF